MVSGPPEVPIFVLLLQLAAKPSGWEERQEGIPSPNSAPSSNTQPGRPSMQAQTRQILSSPQSLHTTSDGSLGFQDRGRTPRRGVHNRSWPHLASVPFHLSPRCRCPSPSSAQCRVPAPGLVSWLQAWCPAFLSHCANFSLVFKTQSQPSPNHATSRKPSLLFLRLGKMSPSGLLVALGNSLGDSCHKRHCVYHGAECTHSTQPRAWPKQALESTQWTKH